MKIKKALGIILLLLIALVMTYKFVDITPDKNLEPGKQAKKVLKYGQCVACHSHSPELPFYANWPIIGKVVKQDATLAIREFDANIVIDGLKNNQPIDEVTMLCTGVRLSITKKKRLYSIGLNNIALKITIMVWLIGNFQTNLYK